MLSSLKKTTHQKKKRIGRGYGSKKGGHTSTRGAKGAKARYTIRLTFDGTKIKKGWIKRLPLLKGKNKLKTQKIKLAIDLDQLEKWYKAKDTVKHEDLLQKLNVKKTKEKRILVKVLSRGQLTKALTVTVPCSQKAVEKIEKAGGRVLETPPQANSAKMKG
jgi:large subunit ribosomal protein L15